MHADGTLFDHQAGLRATQAIERESAQHLELLMIHVALHQKVALVLTACRYQIATVFSGAAIEEQL